MSVYVIENTGNKDRKISFMGTEEYRLALKRAALDRNMDVQALIETALQSYLVPAEKPKVTAIREESLDADHRKILDWLDQATGPRASAGDSTIARLVLERVGITKDLRRKGGK